MEGRGAVNPGTLTLTTGLSKPFMRLDKYPTLLKELERHMEVSVCTNVYFQRSWVTVFANNIVSFRTVIQTGQTFRSAWSLSKMYL